MSADTSPTLPRAAYLSRGERPFLRMRQPPTLGGPNLDRLRRANRRLQREGSSTRLVALGKKVYEVEKTAATDDERRTKATAG